MSEAAAHVFTAVPAVPDDPVEPEVPVDPVDPDDPVDPEAPVEPEEMGDAVAVGVCDDDPSDPVSVSPGWHAVITNAADSAAVASAALRMLLFCMTSPEFGSCDRTCRYFGGGDSSGRTPGFLCAFAVSLL
ncbi:hypothetical protein [Streptomyces sp. cg40]|uniref:hypothetical protein n=1 Tax=Streptomyces sp. cg40 TaxID=3419764 RepID=UPI003D08FCE7